MLKVRRLNMDNSWHIQWDEVSFLIDPWLSGTEVDGFSWFNEQWHASTPLTYEEVNPFDLAIISQGYPDHCHLETLQKLGSYYPVIGVPSATKKLNRKIANPIKTIPKINEPALETHALKIFRLIPNRPIATFNGLVIQKGNEYIFHAPHGGPFSDATLQSLVKLKCKCLITTYTLYQLPFFLGGKINPGKEHAQKLTEQLNPEFILNTHDENKPAKGISNKLAKRIYPEFNKNMPHNFVNINHYNTVELL